MNIPTDQIWVLEYSESHSKKGRFPYHIDRLDRSLQTNMDEYLENTPGRGGGWMIIAVGNSNEEMHKMANALLKEKKNKTKLERQLIKEGCMYKQLINPFTEGF